MVDQKLYEIGCKREVGLFDNTSVIQHPVCALTVYGYVVGYLPLGGLSQILVSLEMTLLNHIPPIVKLGG